MTVSAPVPARGPVGAPPPGLAPARQLDLAFAPGADGATRIARRRVSWPWSLPRGFRLEPGLLTVLPQAAAAALLPGDRWETRLEAEPGAAARIISAGATLVHGGGGPSRVGWDIAVGAGARLELLPEPWVLTAGACIAQRLDAVVAETGLLVLFDGFCRQHPGAPAQAGASWRADTVLRRPDGRVILREHQAVDEDGLRALSRLPGGAGAFGAFTILGPAARLSGVRSAFPPGPLPLAEGYAASAELRGGAGLTLRLVSRDGGALVAAKARLGAAIATALDG
ncbi:urease accessory protein UreD [Paroceanicella profunda]|uniref:Urease accessory protein UreD n=1 Tax=Paroceanicella profunda TaxID=2579971 RepID=A0A5B8FQS6_9RHOB|nr:urease accessory protein UreD [Paroceanicella profunda]QDL91036.1 urease accessory protein UreD [Paroceanicella profunda]